MTKIRAQQNLTRARGFTLVETLVAIAILMIAIVAPFYSVQQAITASFVSRDQLIASSLAQEGVEYIYMLRNQNYLAGRAWLEDIEDCTGTTCTVDATQNSLSRTIAPLRLSPSGLYTQNTSAGYPVTRFTRTVSVRSISATQVEVTVTVAWKTNRNDYSITVRENLYNWL